MVKEKDISKTFLAMAILTEVALRQGRRGVKSIKDAHEEIFNINPTLVGYDQFRNDVIDIYVSITGICTSHKATLGITVDSSKDMESIVTISYKNIIVLEQFVYCESFYGSNIDILLGTLNETVNDLAHNLKKIMSGELDIRGQIKQLTMEHNGED